MPRTRFDELVALSEEHDGLLTAKQARDAGIADSVLARLTQRGRLDRAARGVYRIPHLRAVACESVTFFGLFPEMPGFAECVRSGWRYITQISRLVT